MKYIRTKDDRIVAIPNNSKLVLYDDEKLVIDTTKKGQTCIYGIVEKKADTIEELCDEFVEVSKKGYFKPFLAENRFELFDDYTKEQIYKSSILYGAIWTNKGLIYVAKLNKEGELELL